MLVEIDVDTFCQLGAGWARSPTTDLGEVSKIVVQELWQARTPAELLDDPGLL